MPATLNDVLQKINDISTYTQQSNAACQALGVDCSLDASLADLTTNIEQIDIDSHPDYDLPWVMADGSSGFLMPITVVKNRNVQATVSLVPASDNNSFIAGMIRSSGAQWGLNQMTAGMRARLRFDASPGTAADTNNYAGLNSAWSDSSMPYYHKMTFALSKMATTTYQASLYDGSTWIHAGSGMAQASTSGLNSFPFGVFAVPYIAANSITFPYSGRNTVKGTILYNMQISGGKYDSSSGFAIYEPILRWDPYFKKYRPMLADKTNKNLSTFPLCGSADDDLGRAYYIDVTQGLSERGNVLSPYVGQVTTDIPNEYGNKIIISGKCERLYDYPASYSFITAGDADDMYFFRIGTNTMNSELRIVTTEQIVGPGVPKQLNDISYIGNDGWPYFVICYDSTGNYWYSRGPVNPYSESKSFIKKNYSRTFTQEETDSQARGYLTLYTPVKKYDTDIIIFNIRILDANDNLIHYLTLCNDSGNSKGSYYDCITQKKYELK